MNGPYGIHTFPKFRVFKPSFAPRVSAFDTGEPLSFTDEHAYIQLLAFTDKLKIKKNLTEKYFIPNWNTLNRKVGHVVSRA